MSEVPFMGELMHCCVCDFEKISDPQVQSGWTCLSVDGVRYYVCVGCVPAAREGTKQFERAWGRIFKVIAQLHGLSL